MFFPSHCSACLALVGALLGPVPFAYAKCPLGERLCAAGATASGGCFKPRASTCQDGLICPAPEAICKRGTIGPGACFQIDLFTCDSGRLRALSYVALQPIANTSSCNLASRANGFEGPQRIWCEPSSGVGRFGLSRTIGCGRRRAQTDCYKKVYSIKTHLPPLNSRSTARN
jgi:hypothetical protein